jgi:tRNA pseudouridine55 synthase
MIQSFPISNGMEKVLNLFKRIGETPLERLDRFRVENPKYKDAKLSYAGRLDPMAEGVLIVMVGEENKNRQKYLNLQKEYYFEILFGFATDTFDILGLVMDQKNYSEIDAVLLQRIIEAFRGKRIQKYPPYSSKTVKGKALFEWARASALDDIEIPEREVEIYEIKLLKLDKINKDDVWRDIERRIAKVQGDFRQREVAKKWMESFVGSPMKEYVIASFEIICGSGTYVRAISDEVGQSMGIPAIAWKIVRRKVGDSIIRDSI